VRWRLIDLARWLRAELAVSIDETTVGHELQKAGYVKLTARPRHHAQDTEAPEAFKKGDDAISESTFADAILDRVRRRTSA